MKTNSVLQLAALLVALAPSFSAAQFFGDPPDKQHPWAKHDHNRPVPQDVQPGDKPGAPPSDAIVLFDGTEASFKKNWVHIREKRKTDWAIVDGTMQSMKGAGYIATKEEFGDCQLHVEWKAPSVINGAGQGRGNSGIFLMGVAEVQVLDNFNNPTYADGWAGSVYGVMPPMVNPLRAPGEWQTYDIVFRRPIVKDGKVVDEGSMTVFINGVLVQDAVPLEGGGGYRKRTHPKGLGDVGPLKLQDHGNPVQFRNVWYRALRKRPADGGSDGRLSVEATMAKRAEIADMVLKDAKSLDGQDKMLRLLESLCYRSDDVILKEVSAMGENFVTDVQSKPDAIESRKNEVVKVYRAFKFMNDHKLIEDLKVYQDLNQIMEKNKWKR